MAKLSNIKITDITDNQKIIKLLDKNFISFDIERVDENEIEITPLWDDQAEQDSYTFKLKENEKLSDKEFLAFIERFIDDFDMGERFGDYLSDYSYDRIDLNNIEKDLEKMDRAYSRVKEAITNDRDYYLSKEPFTPLSSIPISKLSAEQVKQITEAIMNDSNKLLKQYHDWAYCDLCFTPKEILKCDKILKHIESCKTDLFLNDEKKNVALKDMDDDELLSYARTCQEYGIDSVEAEKVLAKHYVEKVQYALLDFDVSNIDLSNKEKTKIKRQ